MLIPSSCASVLPPLAFFCSLNKQFRMGCQVDWMVADIRISQPQKAKAGAETEIGYRSQMLQYLQVLGMCLACCLARSVQVEHCEI